MAEKNEMDPYVVGFGLSAAIVAIFNGVLNVVKELLVLDGEKILKDGLLKPLGGLLVISPPHHWVGHGLVVVVLFLILGVLFAKKNVNNYFVEKYQLDYNKLTLWILAGVVIGILIIGLFYAWEAFLH
ncbi:MAG: hypothetical protein ACW97Z_05460 [Candidatus Hodarchaeales archaeon]